MIRFTYCLFKYELIVLTLKGYCLSESLKCYLSCYCLHLKWPFLLVKMFVLLIMLLYVK